MKFLHSPESRLLLAGARTAAEPQSIQALLQHPLHWPEILERAERYEIAPLFYANLKKANADTAQIPPAVLERLKRLYYGQAACNMQLYRKLQEVLVAFAEEKIPVIVLKGGALAEVVYPHIALRPMQDVDLLLRKQDLETADRLMRALHYVPDESKHSHQWYKDEHMHLPTYLARDHSVAFEIHYHIIRPPVSAHMPIHDLWCRARPARIAGQSVLLFAPEDLLLHLCLHLALGDHLLGKFRNLCDISATIRHYHGELDWIQFLRAAQSYHIEPFVYYALWLAHDVVAAQVPAQVLHDLRSAIGGGALADLALKRIARRAMLAYDPARSLIPSWAISHTCDELLSTKGGWAKLRAIGKRLWHGFVHSAQQTSSQPRLLAPLYTLFVHPFYLMVRAARRRMHPKGEKCLPG